VASHTCFRKERGKLPEVAPEGRASESIGRIHRKALTPSQEPKRGETAGVSGLLPASGFGLGDITPTASGKSCRGLIFVSMLEILFFLAFLLCRVPTNGTCDIVLLESDAAHKKESHKKKRPEPLPRSGLLDMIVR